MVSPNNLMNNVAEVIRVENTSINFQWDNGNLTTLHLQCIDDGQDISITEVSGDLDDLMGVPILQAELSTSDDVFENGESWTVLSLHSVNGSVEFRWIGYSCGNATLESNYYSVILNQ